MTIKEMLSKYLQKFSKYNTICLLVKGAISDGRTVNESICRNIW